MVRRRNICAQHIPCKAKNRILFLAALLLSANLSPLEATEDFQHSDPFSRLQSTPLLSHSPEWEGERKHEELITRELSAGLGKKLHLTYSLKDQKITGAIETETGNLTPIKSHDLPRELHQIKDVHLFNAFCQNAYARTRLLSNGEVSFSLYQRGLGGGRLHEAAESGDIESLRTLLTNPDTGAQINELNEQGFTPLHCAARRRDTEVARLLLDYGANLHQTGAGGVTALHLSVQHNRLEMCRLLLEREASVEALDDNGRTVLDLVSESGEPAITQLFAERLRNPSVNRFEADELDPLLRINTDTRRRKKAFLIGGTILGAACLAGIGVTIPAVILTRKKPPAQPSRSSSLSLSSSVQSLSFSYSLPFSRSFSSLLSLSSSEVLSPSRSLLSSYSASLSDSVTASHPPSASSSPSSSEVLSISHSRPFSSSSDSATSSHLSAASSSSSSSEILSPSRSLLSSYSSSFSDSVTASHSSTASSSLSSSDSPSLSCSQSSSNLPSLSNSPSSSLPNCIAQLSLNSLNGANGFSLTGVAKSAAGESVSGAGDINGDGINDIIIGAPNANQFAGVSYVVFGHTGTWPSTLSLTSLNGQNGFNLTGIVSSGAGASVSSAGDINGDGVDDIIIGAPIASHRAGASYVVFGHTGTWPSTFSLSSLNGTSGFSLTGGKATGSSVSSAGDLNGDNIADIIIGAPSTTKAGASYVVFGHAGTWSSNISLSDLNGQNGFSLTGGAESAAGWSVSSAGDVNGDGITDVIIGGPLASSSAGASYVVFGHTGTWPSTISLNSLNGTSGFTLIGVAANNEAGWSVSGTGDINGDGIDDVTLGAPGISGTGTSYVIFGHTGTWPSNISLASLNGANGFSLTGILTNLFYSMGIPVRSAGDVNGDAASDMMIGSPAANEAYIIFGQNEGIWPSTFPVNSLSGVNGFSLTGIAAGDYAGWSVSGAGDVNGDGIDDMVIGAPYTNNETGTSYVVFGQHPCELGLSHPSKMRTNRQKSKKKTISTLQAPLSYSKGKQSLLHATTTSSSTRLEPMWTKPFSAAFRAISSFPSFFSNERAVEQQQTATLQRSFNDYTKALNLFKNSDVRSRESYALQAHVKLGLVRGKFKSLSQNSGLPSRCLREVHANFVDAFELPELLRPTLEPLSNTYNLATPLNISLPQPSSSLRIWS